MSTAARVRTDPRISRRRRAIVRSRRRRMLITAGVVAGLAGAIWVAFWSPLLDVRKVVVVGGKHVSSSDVAAAASLGRDDNLLLVSTSQVTEAVEDLPWVLEAKVDRKLPGTVRVKVVERSARIALSVGEARWTLDARGNVLQSGLAEQGMPVLAGATIDEVRPGERIAEVEVRDALAAWRSLALRVRREVAAILAPTAERITFSLHDGTQVRFGAAESLRAKNEVLVALLAQMRAENRSASYIDVRVPTSPAISVAPAPSATVTPTPAP
ncbi:MAG TPA: FtsQ-type POTRA domain-containing protein [Actinomycetota bacterium]|nr:FtsQ-type POTRA domain-containing protein [Actinomycetota bacterium]